ncbi:MAG: hypothetical protein ACRDIC_01390 [bacterium]
MAQMIQATKANVNAAIQFARERQYVTEYPIDRNGKRIGTRLWFHHPTWQLLGQSFGITAYTDGDPKEIKPGTWQAAAIAALIENGQIVGRSVGLCARTELGKGKMPDHHLSSTAQARAQRNALRSCLGAVLIAAGFEISDPEGPATNEQIGLLHQLERELGMTHDEGHRKAGIESYRDLSREQASDIIEEWSAAASPKSVAEGGEAEERANPKPSPPAPATDITTDQPAPAKLWAEAARHALTSGKTLRRAKAKWGVTSADKITGGQLQTLISDAIDKESR